MDPNLILKAGVLNDGLKAWIADIYHLRIQRRWWNTMGREVPDTTDPNLVGG